MSENETQEVAKVPPKMPRIELKLVAEADNQIGLRTRVFIVDAENPKYRDKGTHYLITEKTAEAAELWAVKALNVLVTSGVDIGGDALSQGVRGMARLGVQALGNLPMDLVQDMLAEMFSCIQILPDYPRNQTARNLVPSDTREIMTRFLLRTEVFNIHTDFLIPVVTSTSQVSGDSSTGSAPTPTYLGQLGRR